MNMDIKSITVTTIIMLLGSMLFAEPPYKADGKTILLYHFDEKSGELPKDSSNYKNHCPKGPKASEEKGVFGSAMKYSNNSSIVKLNGVEKLKNAGRIEFWIKPGEKMLNRWGGDQGLLSSNKGGSNAGDFNIGFRMNPLSHGGGNFFLLMEDGKGSYRKLSTPNIIKDSQWYHVVITWDSKSTPEITVDDKVQPLKDSGKNKSYVGPLLGGKYLSVGVSNGPKDASILMDELRITTREPEK
jgi:hypothetical protein